MSLSEGAPQLLGKRITGVVAMRADRQPQSQVFLVFEDGTHYELYSNDMIQGAAGVDRGGLEVVLGLQLENAVVLKAYIDPSRGPQLELIGERDQKQGDSEDAECASDSTDRAKARSAPAARAPGDRVSTKNEFEMSGTSACREENFMMMIENERLRPDRDPNDAPQRLRTLSDQEKGQAIARAVGEVTGGMRFEADIRSVTYDALGRIGIFRRPAEIRVDLVAEAKAAGDIESLKRLTDEVIEGAIAASLGKAAGESYVVRVRTKTYDRKRVAGDGSSCVGLTVQVARA